MLQQQPDRIGTLAADRQARLLAACPADLNEE
jgi:hypothetical protein